MGTTAANGAGLEPLHHRNQAFPRVDAKLPFPIGREMTPRVVIGRQQKEAAAGVWLNVIPLYTHDKTTVRGGARRSHQWNPSERATGLSFLCVSPAGGGASGERPHLALTLGGEKGATSESLVGRRARPCLLSGCEATAGPEGGEALRGGAPRRLLWMWTCAMWR